MAGWGTFREDDKVLMRDIDSDAKDEVMFLQTCSGPGCNWSVTEDLNSSNQPTWNWSNQNAPNPSGYINDWPIYSASGGHINYMFIKPHPSDKAYLMAFRQTCSSFLVNMYKTTNATNYKEMSNEPESHSLQKNLVTIFPNPGNGIFTVSSANLIKRIIVTDIIGKVVYVSDESIHAKIVDISTNAKGVYFVKVNTADGSSHSNKVVVE